VTAGIEKVVRFEERGMRTNDAENELAQATAYRAQCMHSALAQSSRLKSATTFQTPPTSLFFFFTLDLICPASDIITPSTLPSLAWQNSRHPSVSKCYYSWNQKVPICFNTQSHTNQQIITSMTSLQYCLSSCSLARLIRSSCSFSIGASSRRYA